MHKAAIDFSHSLYNQQALEQTKEAYASILNADFEHVEGNSHAEFETEDDNGPLLVDAFCNHALFLTIQMYREGDAA